MAHTIDRAYDEGVRDGRAGWTTNSRWDDTPFVDAYERGFDLGWRQRAEKVHG